MPQHNAKLLPLVRIFVTLLFVACISADAMAADSISPGLYTTKEGWGNLTVKRTSPDSSLSFSIFTTAGNAHMCQVEGEIQNNQGVATQAGCVVQFELKGNVLTVKGGPECLDECGANSDIDGEYFLQAPQCVNELDIREEFNRLYQSGKYLHAKKLLTELLSKCEINMNWRSYAPIRNDLAITYFHLGNKSACLKTLEPLKEWFIDDLSNGKRFAPADEDWAHAMVNTTRFNWNKCGGASN